MLYVYYMCICIHVSMYICVDVDSLVDISNLHMQTQFVQKVSVVSIQKIQKIQNVQKIQNISITGHTEPETIYDIYVSIYVYCTYIIRIYVYMCI